MKYINLTCDMVSKDTLAAMPSDTHDSMLLHVRQGGQGSSVYLSRETAQQLYDFIGDWLDEVELETWLNEAEAKARYDSGRY